MWDEWLSKKADKIQSFADQHDEIQSFADEHDSKCLYEALTCVYGPQSSGSLPLLSADGTKLITDHNIILDR